MGADLGPGGRGGPTAGSFLGLSGAHRHRRGFPLVGYHSTRKAELDAAARTQKIDRELPQLGQLRQNLASPRTRHRQAEKLRKTLADILQECGAEDWIQAAIESGHEETCHQSKPGRPSNRTRCVRRVTPPLTLDYRIDVPRVAQASSGEGVFPLVTNVTEISPRECLFTYKRQPLRWYLVPVRVM